MLLVKNLPANADRRERRRFDPWEDPLEEERATHSSILAQRIPMDRGAWWATVHRVTKSQTQLKRLNAHTPFNPLRVALGQPAQIIWGSDSEGPGLLTISENEAMGLQRPSSLTFC